MLELYHSDISPCAQKIKIQLFEKDLPWTSRPIDLQAGDQFVPSYVALNPKSVVPTLVHNGEPITESTLIAEFLEDAFPRHPLRPQDPVDRSRMRWWAMQLDAGAHMAIGKISFSTARRHQLKAKMTPEQLETHLNNIPNEDTRFWQLQVIEQGVEAPLVLGAVRLYQHLIQKMNDRLTITSWLAGNEFTLADAAWAPYLTRLDWLGMSGFWTGKHPAVAAWYDKIRARPSYKAAITDVIPTADIEFLTEYGSKAWPQIKVLLNTA